MSKNLIKIMFICHGNICRSPMAEFLMKDLVKKRGLEHAFRISSCATSYEEEGNPVHYGTKRILDQLGISCEGKRARRLEKSDYDEYDYFVCMDSANVRNANKIFQTTNSPKVKKLLEYVFESLDVADPWYTGDFSKAYEDINRGVNGLFNYLYEKKL